MSEVVAETWVDKSEWGDGAWQNEPDRMEWYDPATDLACLMLRNPHGGHWCGYVGVLPGHPWHGVSYTEAHDEWGCDPVINVGAHGGVTFTDSCMEDNRPQRERVCHVPRPGDPEDVWWIGFDYAHGEDLTPGFAAMRAELHTHGHYRDADYVKRNCTEVAAQVAAAALTESRA